MSQSVHNLNDAQQEALAILAEECAEVIQAVQKIQRHGLYSEHPDTGVPNTKALEMEIGHVQAATELAARECELSIENMALHISIKHQKMKPYLHALAPFQVRHG